MWRWSDVVDWFVEALGEPLSDTDYSAFLHAFNDALELRRLADRLDKQEREAVARLLPAELVA